MRKLLSLALAALGMAGLAQAQEYSLHGRVSHDEGAMLIRGGNGSDWAHATNNGLVLSGDTLWIDEAGVGEVEFPGGNFLRLADRSKIDVSSVDPISLRAWTGAFYVQRLARSQGVLVVETPAATIGVRPDTSVRIDVNSGGLTTVSVRWGEAEVRGPVGGAVIVTGGRRSYIEAGLLPSEPVSFDRAVEDSFDSWSRNRSDYLANGVTAVPAEVQVAPTTIGVSDLNNYGEWVYIDRRPYWRPTVIVDYVPYRLGYWNYVPSYGHVWCGTAPFSYVTSHYGRWTHHATYGWCWGYDPVWRPAWAVTVRCGDYYAWTPCDWNNRPVVVQNSAYFNIGGVQFSVASTSYVPYGHAYHGPYHVRPWDPYVFRPYYGNNNTIVNVNVNVWNIDGRRDRRADVNPFGRNALEVRDYAPRRSIRGVDTLFDGDVRAVDRAQRLEQGLGRQDFTRVARARSEADARPTRVEEVRESARRDVRVERRGDTSFTRDITREVRRDATLAPEGRERAAVRRDEDPAVRGRAEGAEGRATTRGGRGERDARLDMDGVSPVRGSEQAPAQDGRTPREGSVRTSDPATGERVRGEAIRTTPPAQGAERGNARSNEGRDTGRTTAPAEGRERGSVRTTPPAAETARPRGEVRTTPPAEDRTRGNVRTEAPSTSGRSVTRTETPSTGRTTTRTEAPSTGRSVTRTETPSTGRSTVRPAEPAQGRTQSRPTAPAANQRSVVRTAPAQPESRGTVREYSAPRSQQQPRVETRPQVRQQQQQRIEAPAPQQRQRSNPAPRVQESPRVRVQPAAPQAPQRSYERSAPSRGNVDAGAGRSRGERGR